MAVGFVIAGFLLTVIGIGLWSVPAAFVVAGLVLFLAGGLEAAKGRS
jgi:hypothetical protein